MRYRRDPENPAVAAEHAMQRRLQAERQAAEVSTHATRVCVELGLIRDGDTSEQRVKRMRDWLRAATRPAPVQQPQRQREPGDDDELVP